MASAANAISIPRAMFSAALPHQNFRLQLSFITSPYFSTKSNVSISVATGRERNVRVKSNSCQASYRELRLINAQTVQVGISVTLNRGRRFLRPCTVRGCCLTTSDPPDFCGIVLLLPVH